MASRGPRKPSFAVDVDLVEKFRIVCYAKGLSANWVLEGFMERVVAAADDSVAFASLVAQEPTTTRIVQAKTPDPAKTPRPLDAPAGTYAKGEEPQVGDIVDREGRVGRVKVLSKDTSYPQAWIESLDTHEVFTSYVGYVTLVRRGHPIEPGAEVLWAFWEPRTKLRVLDPVNGEGRVKCEVIDEAWLGSFPNNLVEPLLTDLSPVADASV